MLKYSIAVIYFLYSVSADIPVECLYEDIRGQWTFYIGNSSHDQWIDCSQPLQFNTTYRLELKYPNVVNDEYGNEGTWTMIYNSGYEVVIHGRKFFAFSKYNDKKVSLCNETLNGWTHDVFGKDWSCYYGIKDGKGKQINRVVEKSHHESHHDEHKLFKTNQALIEEINNDPSIQWYAKSYKEFENMSIKQMKMMGGNSFHKDRPTPAPASMEIKMISAQLPEEFDWRNVRGENYVSPVRNQQYCGSCYAFASVGMNEARLRVATKNKINVTLSPQDVLDCNLYSQGCGGGEPYLTAGKYAEDHGMVEENCAPYKAMAHLECPIDVRANCTKYYFTGYEYIGGYYGACNEDLMKIALVNHGPISVDFEVYQDFFHYKGGIYSHTAHQENFNPFIETDHSVLLVGYGVDRASGTKYWIIKNSWGGQWGEEGYFRIKRGNNECGIESSALQTFPIF